MDDDRRRRAARELGELAAADAERRPGRDRRDLVVLAGLERALRSLRRRRGLSQAAVARRAGLTRPMISSYENGRHQPSLATLDQLLAALEVTPAELADELAADDPRTPGVRA